ncbi:hypothetical protein VTI74DRAFT_1783 [Chaetomium olivicolor]
MSGPLGGEEGNLAMEAIVNLIANVPDWCKKLDELNSQIEQRQIELAKLEEETKAKLAGSSGAPKSIRNKGSTESLKARDEPAAHPRDPITQTDGDNVDGADEAAAAGAAAAKADADQPPMAPSSPTDSHSPSVLARQESQMRAAGQARARATLRKRQRTDSMISAENPTPKYRSRSMIIVYYDSYVQSFFEELVKFVSASRNMMRKAKMAAKVEAMRRAAQMDQDDSDSDDKDKEADKVANSPTPLTPAAALSAAPPATSAAGDGPIEAAAPAPPPPAPNSKPAVVVEETTVHFVPGSRRVFGRPGMRGMYGRRVNPASLGGMAGDSVFDELDRGLEYVQSMCEHAAHQFLRDGECAEEVANIKSRLGETKELADREMERVKREDPDALKRLGEEDGLRGRSYRPQSMRRDGAKPRSEPPVGVGKLEVDEGFDDGEGEQEVPKLVYKTTRMLR